MTTKAMAFAGSWYPDDSDACKASILEFLNEKDGPLPGNYIGGIVPHAGWFYSGSIACRVIASLGKPDDVDLVILFGGHMHPSQQPLIMSEGGVETPFGNIKICEEIVGKIAGVYDGDFIPAARFPDENTLELQYPFIKYFYPDAEIFICCVPPSSIASKIGKDIVFEAEKLSRKVRMIGSTDMSHYGPNFGFTPKGNGAEAVQWVKEENDQNAIEAMAGMDPEQIIYQGLTNKNMCCSGAAAATAVACKTSGAASSVTLDYATSYEKSGGSSFVGYSGILYALP